MANYNGRRGPNVSQYLAELNTIPTEMPAAPAQPLGMDDDFALFTNAEFFDFDLGDMPEMARPVDYDPVQEERARRQNASAFRYSNSKTNEPLATGDFSFPVYSNFQNVVDQSATANFQQPSHSGAQYPYAEQSPAASSPNEAHALPGGAGSMSQLDSLHDQGGLSISGDDVVRVAAEEDKRRRNTAASARFRIKKKQREQALERTAKEMSEKVQVLQSKVTQLEMENKWLKSLITEKNDNRSDVTDLVKKFTDRKTDAERSTGERNDGVGTKEEIDSKPTMMA